MDDIIIKLRGTGTTPDADERYIQIVGAGTSRAYVWTPLGYATVAALRRALDKHDAALNKEAK